MAATCSSKTDFVNHQSSSSSSASSSSVKPAPPQLSSVHDACAECEEELDAFREVHSGHITDTGILKLVTQSTLTAKNPGLHVSSNEAGTCSIRASPTGSLLTQARTTYNHVPLEPTETSAIHVTVPSASNFNSMQQIDFSGCVSALPTPLKSNDSNQQLTHSMANVANGASDPFV